MAFAGIPTITTATLGTYFESYAKHHFTYLFKGMKGVRTFPNINQKVMVCQIWYHNGTERTFTYREIDELTEKLQAANNNLAPKEAWQFHH